ncbi:MAG: LptF/LptG family permease [Candidatus Portiera sp.]|nr:LptF/LptG family permease [Portiera sp.]
MKILPQNLQRQLLLRTLGIFLLGNLILLTNQLFLTFSEILYEDLPLRFLWSISLLFLIFKSGFLLNSCYLLALLFFMAGLYEKNEIYIMKNMGIGEGKLFAWLALPSVFMSLLVGALVFYFSPISIAEINRIYSNGLTHQFQDIQEGSFDFSDSNSFRVQNDNLEIWSIYPDRTSYSIGKLDQDNQPYWDSGEFKIPLNDGRSLNWVDDGSVVDTKFAKAELSLYYANKFTSTVQSSSTWSLLKEELSRANIGSSKGSSKGASKRANIETREGIVRRVEIYERMAIFISSLLMLPLALVASRRQVRARSAKNVFAGLLAYFGYLILMFAAIGTIRSGGSPVYFWGVNIGSFVILLSMLIMPNLTHRMRGTSQPQAPRSLSEAN